MVLIDTNALVVLIVGLVEPNLFKTHNKTSIYDKDDFEELLSVIESVEHLIILPNVWTELDNLLNGFTGHHKEKYIEEIKAGLQDSTEIYVESKIGVEHHSFYNLGLTDSLILHYSLTKDCELLITSDSQLSDYARANEIAVYDMVKIKNEKING